jgi:hypothetical protein
MKFDEHSGVAGVCNRIATRDNRPIPNQGGDEMTRLVSSMIAAIALLAFATAAQAQVHVYVPPVRVQIAPPPVRVEVQPAAPGAGYTWIAGHWAWRGGAHVWIPGHWAMPPQPGYHWQAARWVNENGAWVFYEGHWIAPVVTEPAPIVQTPPPPSDYVVQQAPPEPIVEVRPAAPQPSWVWIPGYWHWQGNRHVWVAGHWSPPQAGYAWEAAHWQHFPGAGWRFVPGHWRRR